MTQSGDDSASGEALLQRVALASLRVDLDLLSGKARDEARAMLARSESEFDGQKLVEICLRDAQPEVGPRTLERSLLGLRSRFLGLETVSGSAPRRGRRRSSGKRFLAWLFVKLIFWPILIALTVVILVLVKRQWPEADVYEWGDKAMSFLGLR